MKARHPVRDPAGVTHSAGTTTDPGTTRPEALFGRVLCGIDGSRASLEAARQAAMLAAGGELALVAVTWTTGAGPTEMTALGETRAQAALEAAAAAAAQAGATPGTELLHAPHAGDALLERAAGADLAVVGTHGGSRRAGIFLGSVASRLVHSAAGPVLVARRPPDDAAPMGRIVLASDGSEASFAAADVAGRIAGRFGSTVILLSVGMQPGAGERRALAVQAAGLLDATGVKPAVVEPDGKPADEIVAAARDDRAALVVTGSRGLGRLKALGSVSERVVHAAPCSVLVAR
jgi:nucleotide-binding universal stress UspA family protein